MIAYNVAMPIRDFTLAVVGAPYANKDGSNRQFEIKLCSRGEPVELRPEPKNKYDEHAIAVFSSRGAQIGYLPSERAPYVGGLMRAGHIIEALFQEETSFGAAVRIGVDRTPVLPPASPSQREGGSDELAEADRFYPDEEWPDE